jgi:hypothetical protein
MSPTRRILTAALPVVVLLAACETPEQEPPADPPEAAAEDPEAGATGQVPHTVTALDEVGGSGVMGEAMVMRSDETVVVALELEGLPEEREYAAHIHRGTCAEGGPVAHPLNPVMGLDDGRGSSTTMFEADEISPDEPYFFQVHGGDGAPIACGDMEEGPDA